MSLEHSPNIVSSRFESSCFAEILTDITGVDDSAAVSAEAGDWHGVSSTSILDTTISTALFAPFLLL